MARSKRIRGGLMTLSTRLEVLLSIFLIAAALGCASRAPDLVRQGAVTVERHPKDFSGRWSGIWVRRTESGTAISGEFRKRSFQWGTPKGHVDIGVVSPDGIILAETSAPYDCGYGTGKIQRARFSAVLPIQVPEGSAVRVIHDSGRVEEH